MQEADSELLAFMKAKGLNQAQIARRARVSQASVSRALKGSARKRLGKAHTRLFNYIQKENRRAGTIHADKDQVLQAFNRIWGASQAHAAAVAQVIDALDALRRYEKEE
jgi:transcriptional regulator with XRE-family HTH domain